MQTKQEMRNGNTKKREAINNFMDVYFWIKRKSSQKCW